MGVSDDLVKSLMWNKDNALVYVDGMFVNDADKQAVLDCV